MTWIHNNRYPFTPTWPSQWVNSRRFLPRGGRDADIDASQASENVGNSQCFMTFGWFHSFLVRLNKSPTSRGFGYIWIVGRSRERCRQMLISNSRRCRCRLSFKPPRVPSTHWEIPLNHRPNELKYAQLCSCYLIQVSFVVMSSILRSPRVVIFTGRQVYSCP